MQKYLHIYTYTYIYLSIAHWLTAVATANIISIGCQQRRLLAVRVLPKDLLLCIAAAAPATAVIDVNYLQIVFNGFVI